MERLTDEQLVDLVRQGSHDAFRVLANRHKSWVFTLAYRKTGSRETAEDLAQEVFLKLYRSLDRYRGESRFTTWLYRLTANTITDYLRGSSRTPVVGVLLDKVRGWFSDPREEPESQLLEQEKRDSLQSAVRQLPEKYKDIVILHYFKQLSLSEIAAITALPVKTVETRLYRGKAILKNKWLEVYGNEELQGLPSQGSRSAALYKP